MVDYTVFVDYGDTHGALEGMDRATNASGAPYVFAGNTEGIIASYATLAAAIADTANLYDGQYVNIAGGDNQGSGFTNEDAGIWEVTSNNGAAYGDYTKVLDISDKASEVEIADANGFFTGTTVESALDEIGDKQVAYKLGDTSLYSVSVTGSSTFAFDSAIAALVLDNGSFTDPNGSGTSVVNGVITNSSIPYRIPLRDSTSQDVIDDGFNNEVYARVENVSGVYLIEFYSNISGSETTYSFSPSAAASIDLGYIFVSMDLMKLPPLAGLNDSHFFGDQSGIVGIVDEANISTGPFTDLLLGLSTQEAVNLQVDSLGSSTNGEGASLIAIEDAGGYFTGADVEGALQELGSFITNLEDADIAVGPFTDLLIGQTTQEGVNNVVDDLGSAANGEGASLIAIEDVAGWFTATDVEGALAELSSEVANITAGITNDEDVVVNGMTDLLLGTTNQQEVNIIVDSLGTTTSGEGASLIGIEDAGGYFTGADVEAALQELGSFVTNLEDADIAVGPFTDLLIGQTTQEGVNNVVDSLGSAASGEGASLIAINDAGNWFTATDVEGALQELSSEVANISAGITNDEDVVVTGMTDLLLGTTNQQDVNIIVDSLGTTTSGEGASLIGIEDAGGYFDGADVEAALQEIGADILAISGASIFDEDVIVSGMTALLLGTTDQEDVNIIVDSLGSSTSGEGASLIAINDAGNWFTATDVEGALQELSSEVANITAGITNDEDVVVTGMTDLLFGVTNQEEVNIIVDSLGTTTSGEGASLIGIEDLGGYFTGTDVEAALQEIGADLSTLSTDKINSTTAFNADGAIGAGTTPQLVSVGTADNDATLTNAISGGNVPAIGFATGAAYSDNDPIDQGDGVVFSGLLGGFSGLTAGDIVYANPNVAGGITQTKPTDLNDYIQIVGVAVSATEIIVRIQPAELIVIEEPTAKPIIFRDTSATGIGESGFNIQPGCLWLDNDASFQNPDKNSTGRFTLYVATASWTGTGANLTKAQVTSNFTAIGKQG